MSDPWQDATLEFRFEGLDDTIVETLNNVRLPRSFSGLFHIDTGELELTRAVFRFKHEANLTGQHFTFPWKGADISCSFTEASPRLMNLARIAYPCGPAGYTYHRNLGPFSVIRDRGLSEHDDWELASLRLSGIPWNEDNFVKLARYFNFRTWGQVPSAPRILVHGLEHDPVREANPPSREISFPSELSGQDLNDELVELWNAARESHDALAGFMYAYQILEYIAYYHRSPATWDAITQLASAPSVMFDFYAQALFDHVANDNPLSPGRIAHILKERVSYDAFLREVEKHDPAFYSEIRFDGGVVLPPLLARDDSHRQQTWHQSLTTAARQIRNAIVHVRHPRQGTTIRPTERNQKALVPWVALLLTATWHAVEYEGASP